MRRFFPLLAAFLPLLFLAGFETAPPGIQAAKVAMAQKYATETPGDYFIGRRYYKPDFKFWGYIRRPGQPWSESQLVMLNEKQKLAPDREKLEFGSDNNYEYKLYGYFSGDKASTKAMAEMSSGRFSGLFVSSLERKSGPQLYPRPVFSPAHLLQILACSKKTRTRSQRRSAIAKAAKAIAGRAYPATNRRASLRPIARKKTTGRSGLDAAARRCGSRAILQYRPALERIGRP